MIERHKQNNSLGTKDFGNSLEMTQDKTDQHNQSIINFAPVCR